MHKLQKEKEITPKELFKKKKDEKDAKGNSHFPDVILAKTSSLETGDSWSDLNGTVLLCMTMKYLWQYKKIKNIEQQ